MDLSRGWGGVKEEGDNDSGNLVLLCMMWIILPVEKSPIFYVLERSIHNCRAFFLFFCILKLNNAKITSFTHSANITSGNNQDL